MPKVGTWGESHNTGMPRQNLKTSVRSLSQRETTWYEKTTSQMEEFRRRQKKLLVLKEVLVNKRNIKDLYTKCLNKGSE